MSIEEFQATYLKLIQSQQISEHQIDYRVLEENIPNLQKLADISNTIVSVFDLFQQKHVFYSNNTGTFLGYSPKEIEANGDHFIAANTHPDDFWMLTQNSLLIFKLFLNFSIDQKINHKLINEFRIKNASNQYVRVIEQHQALELDKSGKLWLSLSILDISPNQDLSLGLKSQILNFQTGKFLPITPEAPNIHTSLTQREIQILKLIKEGLLSKEISDKLSISVHTVNTHRQRVLGKLGANNSMEAVILASRLGLA